MFQTTRQKANLWVLINITCYYLCHGIAISVVSVFRPDESDFHKYSAVLAATEPLRLTCEKEIKENVNPFILFIQNLKGASVSDPKSSVRLENKAVDDACNKYERKVDEIVKSYGLDVESFNELSQTIASNKALKRKVALQAYYYRIAADLESNLKKTIPILPTIEEKQIKPTDIRHGDKRYQNSETADDYGQFAPPSGEDSKFQSYCKVLRNVELVRRRMRDSLKRTLGLSQLPENMCSPDYLPAMNPIVQSACRDFPNTSTAIIERHGLDTEEFNLLQNKVKKDLLFRYRVQHHVDKLKQTYGPTESIKNKMKSVTDGKILLVGHKRK